MDYRSEAEAMITTSVVKSEMNPPADFHRSEDLEAFLKSLQSAESLSTRNEHGFSVPESIGIAREHVNAFFKHRTVDSPSHVAVSSCNGGGSTN